MIRSVTQWPGVARDLADLAAYIALDKLDPALRLLVIAHESFNRLAESPFIGREWKSKNPRLRGIRHYPLPYPYRSYIVFYRVNPDSIEVITVQHGSRDLEDALLDVVE